MARSPSPSPSLKPLSAAEEAVLRSLTRLIYSLPRALDAELDLGARLTLNEYHTLMHLSHAPERRMRMSELARRCNLSLSGMSQIVSRLESQDFVRRARDSADGRGANAGLTSAGLARLEQAWPTFLAASRRLVFDHLAGLPLTELSRALQACADASESGSGLTARP